MRPIHPIRHIARHQREQQRGQKLIEADEAQIPGTSGQLVHLPANGHHQHLAGCGARQAGEPEAQEGTLLEQGGKTVLRHDMPA